MSDQQSSDPIYNESVSLDGNILADILSKFLYSPVEILSMTPIAPNLATSLGQIPDPGSQLAKSFALAINSVVTSLP